MSLSSFDWALCRSFLAILRTGSLSGAARSLKLTHPTLRRHLEALELALGGPLFLRSPAGLAPTELALDLRNAAEAMESAFEQLVREATDNRDAVTGTIRLTASEVMGVEVLPPILQGLGTTYPALEFELDLTDDIVDVLRRDADIAVRMVRPRQDALVARRVGQVAVGLYAHRSWVDRYGANAPLDALIRQKHLIGYDREPLLTDLLERQGIAVSRRDFGFRSDSTLAHLAAMRAGLGAAFIQAPLAERDPELVRLCPDLAGRLEIWLVSHPTLRANRRVRAYLDALALELAHYAAGPGITRRDA